MTFFASVARWILFLPAAYIASRLVFWISMFLAKYQPFLNENWEMLLIQGMSSAGFGYVGVFVAPNFKRLALGFCLAFNLIAAIFYVAKFSDFLGVLSFVAIVGATFYGGFMALQQHLEVNDNQA